MKDREYLAFMGGQVPRVGQIDSRTSEGPERLCLGEVERAESTESGLCVDRVPW